MIKSYTAFTSEVDDADAAVSEILKQLDPEKNCLKNTVGIISCYYEFAENGITAELYKKLKFPIIGTTTTAIATNNGFGQLDLAILMLTSDDVTFTAAYSSSLKDELETPLTQMYQSALAGHIETPKLILSAAPLLPDVAGDYYVDILNKVSGGVPNFGTLAIDDDPNYSYASSYVILNNKVEKDIYGIVIMSGNIYPKFLHASFSPEFIFKQTATITKSEGNLLKEVNDMPLIDYMETLGLASNGKVRDVLHSVPFILDYSDEGIPVSRSLLSWTEDGYALCAGLMPEGTRVSLGTWDKSDVIGTTTRTIDSLLSAENVSSLLLYSCLARSFALGTDILMEANKAKEIISDKIPYLFAYSGGEICPVSDAANTNGFHNNTIIACVL